MNAFQSSRSARGIVLTAAASLALLLGGTACRQDMHNNPKFLPLRTTTFFPDHRSARPFVEGTIARGQLNEDDLLYRGLVDGKPATVFPFPITPAVLARGQERFNIYCSVCHDRTGSGQGMIVKRGFPPPPSYHIDRLREAPVGHFFDVITNGFGTMYSYASRIPVEDRWAIIAYIRCLQRAQNGRLSDVPPDQRAALESNAPALAAPAPEQGRPE